MTDFTVTISYNFLAILIGYYFPELPNSKDKNMVNPNLECCDIISKIGSLSHLIESVDRFII